VSGRGVLALGKYADLLGVRVCVLHQQPLPKALWPAWPCDTRSCRSQYRAALAACVLVGSIRYQ
jgi:hypothetical protein